MSFLNDKNKPDACKVCGETNSAGWHCGTITCEACKKFFLRNAKSEYLNFTCVRANNSCVVTKSTRTNCAFCRFQKCIQVGMKQNEKTSNETVPFTEIPCRVCGDSSSGLHFGAITCEGCKGFFRRNIKDGHKYTCSGNGQCEISHKSRNACRSCRFNKCVQVGMDLKKCMIGRQSNLTKQKIKCMMDKPGSDTMLQNLNNLNEHTEAEGLGLEESLDEQTKFIVKRIFQSYQVLESIQNNLLAKNLSQDYDFALELIKEHSFKCANFISNISYLTRFNQNDQNLIWINSIHPLRILQLIKLQQQREQLDIKPANQNFISNYFDCDQQNYEKIIQFFPVFKETFDYYKELAECVKELKLDSREFALYSAYLAYSTACRGLQGTSQKFEIGIELSRVLNKYMFLRRSENESFEKLVSLVGKFDQLNIRLQKGIYLKCKEMMEMNVRFENIYHKIFELND